MTELCEIAYKYGTDKCPQLKHSYTPFYYEFLKDRRQSIKKILEMGIGQTRKSLHGEYLQRGASLCMWRDFFPSAQIYGADIHSETMFKGERIETFLCDETKKNNLNELIKKTGSDIDLFIDDGHHHKRRQIFLCRILMPMFKKEVIYVIEDVRRPQEIADALSEYDCYIPEILKKYNDDGLVVVTKNKFSRI